MLCVCVGVDSRFWVLLYMGAHTEQPPPSSPNPLLLNLHPPLPPFSPMAVPVSVLRLPRGPDSSGRGFGPSTQRPRRDPPPEVTEATRAIQRARAALRRRFLLCLVAARGQRVTFVLCQRVRVNAVLGAAWVPGGTEGGGSDGGAAVAFQVDALQTPLGVQKAALLRGGDVVAFGFQVGGK